MHENSLRTQVFSWHNESHGQRGGAEAVDQTFPKKVFEMASAIETKNEMAKSQYLYCSMSVCDWSFRGKLNISRIGCWDVHATTFPMLAAEDDPKRQLLRSTLWAKATIPQPKFEGKPFARALNRPRIGYLTSDFYEHATMHLISGLLRQHEKSKFEIHIFNYGKTELDKIARGVKDEVEFYHDLSSFSDRKAWSYIRDIGLDIAIDLKGYTHGTRTHLLSQRLAPVQMNYLGYPGSLGAEFIDYIIADNIVIPNSHEKFYSEKVIRLPHCYQPNDSSRRISDFTSSKSDLGLPEAGVVLCCFNNNYKIGEREFEIWMRIMNQVDQSVLWLLDSNQWSKTNITQEAHRRGVDPKRIVFAARAPLPEHLARHVHADIFLDTFNYNAHTTASDALWAGLPIVTKIGEQFAARVAASLLTSIGLEELICRSETEYEHKILAITTDKKEIDRLKGILRRNRLSYPLFDTERYVKNFECALVHAISIDRNGQAPHSFSVVDPDGTAGTRRIHTN